MKSSISPLAARALTSASFLSVVLVGADAFAAPNYAPSSGAFDTASGPGLRMVVLGTNWEVGQVWRDSEAEEVGIEIGDRILSINGVTVPTLPASFTEVEDFNLDVAAARTNGVDDYYLTRGGGPFHKYVQLSDVWTQFRRASLLADIEADSSDPNAPADSCWICVQGVCEINGQGVPQCFDGVITNPGEEDPPCAMDQTCTCNAPLSFL